MQLATVVRNTRNLYDACIANGFVMPARSSNLCTRDFMMAVKSGEVFVPKKIQIPGGKLVARPPTRKMLEAEIAAAITALAEGGEMDEEHGHALVNLLDALEARSADVPFLTQILYYCDPSNHIFDKSYRYRRPKTSFNVDNIPLIPNEGDFFSNLPELTAQE